MEITDVRIKKVESGNKTKALASITFDEVFVVHGLKVVEGLEEDFVVMPSRKSSTGEYKDIAHPLVQSFRDEITKKVLEAYNNLE